MIRSIRRSGIANATPTRWATFRKRVNTHCVMDAVVRGAIRIHVVTDLVDPSLG